MPLGKNKTHLIASDSSNCENILCVFRCGEGISIEMYQMRLLQRENGSVSFDNDKEGFLKNTKLRQVQKILKKRIYMLLVNAPLFKSKGDHNLDKNK